MLSMNDIINASFRKSGFSGYRTDDVDQFIDQVKESYDVLIKKGIEQKEEYEKLKSENDQLLEKLKILAAKVEDYRVEEDEIKNALVSAQKLGDASIRESRHKAEIIIKDANIKAERIISGAKQSVIEQQDELERLHKTVSDFRSKLLSTYKEHLTLIDALPTQKEAPKATEQEQPAPQLNASSEVPVAPQQIDTADKEPNVTFNADISNFDDDLPISKETASRFSSIQFSDEYDISDDNNTPDGILNPNK
ncbi:MAG: DivIVA protein [Caproiciproducens sp.]|nr:DivIVA protein [Caproiciproducens sp.]